MIQLLILVGIGLGAGIAAGFFGIGGGLIIVPALVHFLGFEHHRATGTSLVVLLPPIGLGAVIEYYRHGNVDWKAAIIIAGTLFLGAWIGAIFANRMAGYLLKLLFGLLLLGIGVQTVRDSIVSMRTGQEAAGAAAVDNPTGS